MFQRVSRIVGIDISDTSVEAVFVDVASRQPRWLSRARVVLPDGLVEHGDVRDTRALGLLIKKMLQAATPRSITHKDVVMNVSDRHVVSRLLTVPSDTARERFPRLIVADAEGYVPYPIQDVEIDYAQVSSDGKNKLLFYAAVPKVVVENLRSVANAAGLTLVDVDLELLALARLASIGKHGEGAHLILDIGGEVTTISIFDLHNGLRRSAIVPFGGEHLTRALAKKADLPIKKAEVLKRSAGFNPKVSVGRVFFILQKEIQKLLTEVRRTITEFESNTQAKVAGITLAGGTSLLPELPDYIGQVLGLPVQISDPVALGAVVSTEQIPAKQSVLFANALGATMLFRASAVPRLSFLGKGRKMDTVSRLPQKTAESVTDVTPSEPVLQEKLQRQSRKQKKGKPGRFSFGRIKKKFLILAIIGVVVGITVTTVGAYFLFFRSDSKNLLETPFGQPENVELDFPLEVNLGGDSDDGFHAKELRAERSGKKVVPIRNSVQIPSQAKGVVTLINKSDTPQQLVASTRLLSHEGILFRIQDDVTVPAGGSIDTLIIADLPGETGEVDAGRFTIPGLSTVSQQNIYGETQVPTTDGIQESGEINNADIQEIVAQLMTELADTVLDEWKQDLVAGEKMFPDVLDVSVVASEIPQAGSVMTAPEIEMTVEVIGMTLSESGLVNQANSSLADKLSSESSVDKYDFVDWGFELESYDSTTNKAKISVSVTATR